MKGLRKTPLEVTNEQIAELKRLIELRDQMKAERDGAGNPIDLALALGIAQVGIQIAHLVHKIRSRGKKRR